MSMELSVDRTQLSELPRDVLGHPKCPGVHILLSTAVSVTLYMVHVHEIHWIMSMELSVDRTQLSELPRDVLGHPKCPGLHDCTTLPRIPLPRMSLPRMTLPRIPLPRM